MAQRMLPWQPILGSKLSKSDCSPLLVALAFRNGLQHRQSDFINIICDNLAILYVNLVIVGPVSLEFNIAKDEHPVVSFFKINRTDKLSFMVPIFATYAPRGRYLNVD